MISLRINGATAYLGEPAWWNVRRMGNCGHLAVRAVGSPWLGGSGGYCETAWEPTPRELDLLNKGGAVVLKVRGWQPPCVLYVVEPEES